MAYTTHNVFYVSISLSLLRRSTVPYAVCASASVRGEMEILTAVPTLVGSDAVAASGCCLAEDRLDRSTAGLGWVHAKTAPQRALPFSLLLAQPIQSTSRSASVMRGKHAVCRRNQTDPRARALVRQFTICRTYSPP